MLPEWVSVSERKMHMYKDISTETQKHTKERTQNRKERDE